MEELTAVFNPILGESNFELRSEHFDLYQEISNTGFGDMLHDWERNEKYYEAIRKTVAEMHSNGKQVHVLDIGTGTGLLSMMSVKAGADSVTACEAFLPMANCAERIIKANGFDDKIRLVKKRSNELTVGATGDMPQKANLLVAELLDTELIGEGAISIYKHAHANLLTDDVICIPSLATCYAQVVDSSLAAQWNTLKVLANLDGDVLLRTPADILNCKSTAALHDVQLSQMPLSTFHALTEPFAIFDFDFVSKTPMPTRRTNNLLLKAENAGFVNMVYFWWQINLDSTGDIQLSCAPYWAHPDFKQLAATKSTEQLKPIQNLIPWRDHWMQAIYYIPKPLHIAEKGAEFILSCNHDEYSFWFDATANSTTQPSTAANNATDRQFCMCLLHQTYSRTRIGQLNYAMRNKAYLRHLEETITKDAHVLVLGDGNVLGLATARLGAASVICLETQQLSRRFMVSLAELNELKNVQIVDNIKSIGDDELLKITHIFAEPYFMQSIYPWDNFYYGTLLHELKPKLSTNVHITPQYASIICLPVEFVDLQKFNQPIGSCEGFDLRLFDEMVLEAKKIAQTNLEVFGLWEYPCRALAQPKTMLRINFTDFQQKRESAGEIALECEGTCNGVVVWITWHLDKSFTSKTTVSTGPTLPVEKGEYVTWNMFQQQAVYLMGAGTEVLKNQQQKLEWSIEFDPKKGLTDFQFNVAS